MTGAGRSALWLTTNPGLEAVAAEELAERVRAAGLDAAVEWVRDVVRGRALLRSTLPVAELLAMARRLRSVHHLVRPVAEVALPAGAELKTIARALRETPITEMAGAPPFRITAKRRGAHAFNSLEVARVAGAAVIEATGAPVDLENPVVEVRVDVIDELCVIGVQHTRTALSLRHARPYRQRVSLKPNVAYAMLRLAALDRPPAAVADPFCGAGTIMLEAADLFPETELWAGDWDARAVAGTRANLAAAGVLGRSHVRHMDALRMRRTLPPAGIDLVVANPPFGRRLGRGVKFHGFFRRWLDEARAVVRPGGRIAVLTAKRRAFEAAVRRKSGLRLRHHRVVETSGLFPGIFVVDRL
jgi:putative N6-adenine-specific DNA methylase/tRNA (guanine6-N2)-methyltransferase